MPATDHKASESVKLGFVVVCLFNLCIFASLCIRLCPFCICILCLAYVCMYVCKLSSYAQLCIEIESLCWSALAGDNILSRFGLSVQGNLGNWLVGGRADLPSATPPKKTCKISQSLTASGPRYGCKLTCLMQPAEVIKVYGLYYFA